MNVSIGKNGNNIRLRFTYAGRQQGITLPLRYTKENLKLAEIKAAELTRLAILGQLDVVKFRLALRGLDKPQEPKFKPISELYQQWYKLQNVSEHYKLGVLVTVGKHLTQNSDIKKLFETNPRNWKNETFNDYLRVANRFFNWCIENELLSDNPLKKIKSKPIEHSEKRQPFNDDEIKLILDSISGKYRDYFLFNIITGCRPSETLGLQRKHIVTR